MTCRACGETIAQSGEPFLHMGIRDERVHWHVKCFDADAVLVVAVLASLLRFR